MKEYLFLLAYAYVDALNLAQNKANFYSGEQNFAITIIQNSDVWLHFLHSSNKYLITKFCS